MGNPDFDLSTNTNNFPVKKIPIHIQVFITVGYLKFSEKPS